MVRLFYILLLTTVSLGAQVEYVTTIHPFKAIIDQIDGHRGNVYELLPPGASPHTYELKPSDIRTVQKATAIFFGADNLDGWVTKLENVKRISLFEMVPQQNRQMVKYFAGKRKGEVMGDDPHFWTDPLAVKALLPTLTDKLCNLDPAGCEIYRKNSPKFENQLDSLYQVIQNKFLRVDRKEVMLAHPFFQYFLKRFNFKLIGIIETIPGSEPTPRELKEIIDEAKRQNLKLILTHPQISDRPTELIAEATGAKICELDPIGGVAGRETYAELLLYNTQILLEALQ